MKNRHYRNALNLVLAGTIAAALLGCGKEEVVIPVIDDNVLTATVKDALAADPELKGLNIKVAAHAGVVEFSGTIDSYPQMDRAINATRSITGVKSVDDKTVKRESAVAPVAAEPAPAAVPAAPAAPEAPAAK